MLLACLCVGILSASLGARSYASTPPPPKGFFGVGPQTGLTAEDIAYMKAGGIEAVRLPLVWSNVQATQNAHYFWRGFDAEVEQAVRGGLRVLPVILGTPSWAASSDTTM